MAVNDTFADIAALLNPMPARTDDNDDVWNDMAGSVWEAREADAEQLRLGWEHQDEDPLLSTLDSLRARRLRLEADMRLLIAYGRRFVYPRPYKLIDLAEAAGMSISGVRTAYDTDEIDQAAGILGRSPAPAAETAAEPGASDGQRAPAR